MGGSFVVYFPVDGDFYGNRHLLTEIKDWLATTKIEHEMFAIAGHMSVSGYDGYDLVFKDEVDMKLFKMAHNIP